MDNSKTKNSKGIVLIGATFVDIKGYPYSQYIPAGRNAGSHVHAASGGSEFPADRGNHAENGKLGESHLSSRTPETERKDGIT